MAARLEEHPSASPGPRSGAGSKSFVGCFMLLFPLRNWVTPMFAPGVSLWPGAKTRTNLQPHFYNFSFQKREKNTLQCHEAANNGLFSLQNASSTLSLELPS